MTDEQRKMIEELYVTMYDMLYHYANASLKDPTLSEEAVQETFLIACSKHDHLCGSQNPRGWIVNTLKNVIKNIRKKQASTNHLNTILSLQAEAEILGRTDQIDMSVLYGELSETEDFRLVQEQADGLSIREIASKRGIKENACKKRIQRAKEALRKKIEKN